MAVNLQNVCIGELGMLNDLSRKPCLADTRLACDQNGLAPGLLLRPVPTGNQMFDRFRATDKM
jgi:hypothetical protein